MTAHRHSACRRLFSKSLDDAPLQPRPKIKITSKTLRQTQSWPSSKSLDLKWAGPVSSHCLNKENGKVVKLFSNKISQKNIWDLIIVNRPPSRLDFLSLHLGFEETGQENCRLWGCNSDMTVYHFPVKLKHIPPHRPRSSTQIVKSTCWENFTLLCVCL